MLTTEDVARRFCRERGLDYDLLAPWRQKLELQAAAMHMALARYQEHRRLKGVQ